MPTDQTTTEVDYFTWLRHFHGVRKHDAPDDRPVKLNAAVARVATVIAAHVHNERRTAKLGHRRIAECAQVSSATVAKALPILESAGWLIVQRGQRQDNNVYRLASPVAVLRAASVDNSEPTPDLASLSEASLPYSVKQGASLSKAELRTELLTTTTNDLKSSVGGAAHASESVDKGAIELPATWTPNPTHVRIATGKGLDVEALADDFRVQMRNDRRRNWDRAFGKFINEYAEYRAESVFPAFPSDEDDDTPTATVTGPNPTADALAWATGALWSVDINPDTLTADERADIVFACEPTADPHDVARRIRDARDRRHLTVVPNPTVDTIDDVIGLVGDLTEDETDAAEVHLELGFGAGDVARYIEAWRDGNPFTLVALGPGEYDQFVGINNPNPVVTGAQLREALDAIKRALPGGFRGDEMATARESILYGDSVQQVADRLRDGRKSA